MVSTKEMKFKIGAPVTGANFFPRPDITGEIQDALAQDHVLLLAPRRTGKTSILHYLRDNSSDERCCFFINPDLVTSPPN